MNAPHSFRLSCISTRMLNSALIFVVALLPMATNIAQDDAACQTSDIEQSVFAAFAEYHTALGTDSVGIAVQGVESLIESLRAIVSSCSNDTELDLTDAGGEDIGSDNSNAERNTTESEGAGEGTYADPIKENWQISDGEGRWIGVAGYFRLGSELCTRPGGYCKEVSPGYEFVAVGVYGQCDSSRRSRCEFYLHGEFELAGQRGIPYEVESMGIFDDVFELFNEDILPGGVSEGLVFFQAPEDERDFIFGWTPSYGRETIWYSMPEIEQ